MKVLLSADDQSAPTNLINSNSSALKASVTFTLLKLQSPVLVTVILNATVLFTITKSVIFKLTFSTVMLGL